MKTKMSSAPMAHTMKMHIMLMPAKYLTWKITRMKNQATGMLRKVERLISQSLVLARFTDSRDERTLADVCLRMISDMPTTARKPDPVVTQM
jgi:hypothetical protein